MDPEDPQEGFQKAKTATGGLRDHFWMIFSSFLDRPGAPKGDQQAPRGPQRSLLGRLAGPKWDPNRETLENNWHFSAKLSGFHFFLVFFMIVPQIFMIFCIDFCIKHMRHFDSNFLSTIESKIALF